MRALMTFMAVSIGDDAYDYIQGNKRVVMNYISLEIMHTLRVNKHMTVAQLREHVQASLNKQFGPNYTLAVHDCYTNTQLPSWAQKEIQACLTLTPDPDHSFVFEVQLTHQAPRTLQ